MTTPTQAQIEAAAKAMLYAEMECGGAPTRTNKAAHYVAKAALTAAAQVGAEDFQDLLDAQHKRSVDATIERCAQVAEKFCPGDGITTGVMIAAAIRKLKDET